MKCYIIESHPGILEFCKKYQISQKKIYYPPYLFAISATFDKKVVHFANVFGDITIFCNFFMTTTEAAGLQAQFLRGIEDVIPTTSSLVNELSDILEISTDSAYRRMRGETLLDIHEIVKLCDHFQISFDAFSKVKSGMVTFNFIPMEISAESFAEFLGDIKKQLEFLASAKDPKIVFACQDVPFLHHFNYPELANFTIFYWMRTIMNLPDLSKVKYDADFRFQELLQMGKAISDLYSNIPSVEVWTESTVRSTLKQISFYWESGIFESKEDAIRVCADLSKEIEDIERMAEISTKQLNALNPELETKPEMEDGLSLNFKLYLSDIELNNNCQLITIGDFQSVSLGHLSFSSMTTNNESYCKKTEQWLNNIIKKSTLVSGSAEKQRFQFFQNANKMIDSLMKSIEEG